MKRRLTDDELEGALRDVAAHLAYPRERDLLPRVREAIARPAEAGFWAGVWSPRLALVPALATVALLLAATLALQPVGARAAEVLGIRGLDVFFAPATPRPPVATPRETGIPSPAPAGDAIPRDAQRVGSVQQASERAGFRVVLPEALGQPDEVYVRPDRRGPQVFLVYAPRPGLPASKHTGIGALVIEARGAFEPGLVGKMIPPGGPSGPVTVGGARGVWIEGQHDVWFRAPDGDIVFESMRLAGNVLAWEHGDLFVRLEAELTREQALRIASTMR